MYYRVSPIKLPIKCGLDRLTVQKRRESIIQQRGCCLCSPARDGDLTTRGRRFNERRNGESYEFLRRDRKAISNLRRVIDSRCAASRVAR